MILVGDPMYRPFPGQPAVPAVVGAESPQRTVNANRDREKGVEFFHVDSPCLGGTNKVEVLVPDTFDRGKRYRVLYVLPVNAGIGGRWGDCLQVVREAGLHNRHDLICVTMGFDTVPWYGSHASDPLIRHDKHLTETVLPLIEKHYPVLPGRDGRLLLGFSKSGWGAVSLLLRHPELFGHACSWDAPLIMDGDDFSLWGVDAHFGTKERYLEHLPTILAEKNGAALGDRPRLAILGHNLFGNRFACPEDTPHTRTFHELLAGLGIPHAYNNEVAAPHSWNAKWLVPAVETLIELSGRSASGQTDR
jgi:hypothetical protein